MEEGLEEIDFLLGRWKSTGLFPFLASAQLGVVATYVALGTGAVRASVGPVGMADLTKLLQGKPVILSLNSYYEKGTAPDVQKLKTITRNALMRSGFKEVRKRE